MSAPTRVQLKRTKGWRMPENTVKVDRSTRFGNPFAVIEGIRDAATAVDLFRRAMRTPASLRRHQILTILKGQRGRGEGAILDIKVGLPSLRGKNLACWCNLDAPCHADVLLELANATTPEDGGA